MADYNERVADRIIKAREQAGFDREPFALRAGISVKQLRRIEQGKSVPRLATVRKIAETAKVPITEIRPDLDEEEDAIRAQLDRIEEKLDEVLRRLPAPEPAEVESDEDQDGDLGDLGREPPEEEPPDEALGQS